MFVGVQILSVNITLLINKPYAVFELECLDWTSALLINRCFDNILVRMFNDRTDNQHFFANCGVFDVFVGFGLGGFYLGDAGDSGVGDGNAGVGE